MVQDSPSRKMDQFIVRLPDGMRDNIKHAAELNNRSMNAEIVARLEQSFDGGFIPVISSRSVSEALRVLKEVGDTLQKPELIEALRSAASRAQSVKADDSDEPQ